ncbi:cation efflux protein, CzcI family [Paracidovorax anthurii]|uniref:Cobalt-zinc-cadmium efflux system protein n=1 Tax=Paracidovorax anthurii TaxID=78229 RepID=A0A328Z7U8_9BURK|nr:cation efflux protein, CzcI family [Paracidovorax anthurii]RAR78336.1 hypothetical protein AX018_103120 [Paracidovorax anthurii]
MRRWLLIFLLTVLPLQFTWAEAAGYCAHEPTAASQHFGHHVHQHDGSAGASHDASFSGDADQDCGACHAGCAIALIARSLPGAQVIRAEHVPQAQGMPLAPPPALPERPNWPRLA